MAKKSRVEINWNGNVTPEIIRAFRGGIVDIVSRIEVTAKKNTHDFSATGNLAARIRSGIVRRGSSIDGKVWTETAQGGASETTRNPGGSRTTNKGYAAFVEFGTGIYGFKKRPIFPRRAKFLVWRDAKTGKLIFAKKVRGRRATPFFRPAIKKHEKDIEPILKAALRSMP